MSFAQAVKKFRPTVIHFYITIFFGLLLLFINNQQLAFEASKFTLIGLISVTPIVLPGVFLAAWLIASGAGDRVAMVFKGRLYQSIFTASFVGALVPVCGITALPMMAGLLAARVPLAPVMAFWLASPITSPSIFAATVATLGWNYAIGKSVAAVGLGIFGGVVTAQFANSHWIKTPLRNNRLVATLGGASSSCDGQSEYFDPYIWRDQARRKRFARSSWSTIRLILIVLAPAFTVEFLLNEWLQPDMITGYVGQQNIFAIPLAVLVGGPAYLDGFAALPLTRALLENGMSHGAAMAFLVSGGVVSVWGAMAIFPVLNIRPFLLYLGLAIVGSMISGWVFEFMMYDTH
jgi:uncharacterized membrane protein YraQ (UPF0718 family)